MLDQKFEFFKTEQDQSHANNLGSNRSLIKSIDLELSPISQHQDKLTQNLQKQTNIVEQLYARRYIIYINFLFFIQLKNNSKNTREQSIHQARGPQYGGLQPISLQKENSIDEEEEITGFSNDVWRVKGLKIWIIILRLISFITKSNFAASFRLVNRNIFEIIGDKSANYTYYLFNDSFKHDQPTHYQMLKYRIVQRFFVPLRKLTIYQYLGKNKFLMRPESIISVGWNIFILFLLNINVLYVSTNVAFNIEKNQANEYIEIRQVFFNILPSYSFILEIILKFNTCYYSKGTVIENRYMIAKNYLKTSFFFDVFVIIPFFMSITFQLDYLNLILILKVFQIRKFSGTLFERLELSQSQAAAFDLIKLCYTILFAAHFGACLWFVVGSTSDTDKNWVHVQILEEEDWPVQYVTSFYFCIITMTTIGYGDIIPQNPRERTFVIFMAVVAVGVFGYSIGNISNIFAEWQKKNLQFRSDMNDLKKYMRLKGYNKHLSEKVRKYFEYIWTDQSEENEREANKYQDLLPLQLQEEMKIDINMKVVMNIKFLTENFSELFLQQLSKELVEEKYAPDQNIFQQGQLSENLYILERGSLQFYINLNNKLHSQKSLEKIEGRSIPFGHLEFFNNQPHQVSCKSVAFSYILKISKESFLDLLKINNLDYQKFRHLQDQIQFQGKQDLIDLKCKACEKFTHIIKECPMVCGYPNRSKVLLNHRRNVPSDRVNKFKRSKGKKIKTLRQSIDIKNSIFLYMCRDAKIANLIQEQTDVVIQHENQSVSSSDVDTPLKETKHSTPDMNQTIQKNEKKMLSFQSCNDALQDPQTRQLVKNLKGQLKILERHNAQVFQNEPIKGHQVQHQENPLNQGRESVFQGDYFKNISQNLLQQDFQAPLINTRRRLSNNSFSSDYQESRDVSQRPQILINHNRSSNKEQKLVEVQSPKLQSNIEIAENDDPYGKMRGQYKELFYEFEIVKNYERYLKQNNLVEVQQQFNDKQVKIKSQRYLKYKITKRQK